MDNPTPLFDALRAMQVAHGKANALVETDKPVLAAQREARDQLSDALGVIDSALDAAFTAYARMREPKRY